MNVGVQPNNIMFQNIDLNTHTFCISINSRRYEYLCKNFKVVGLNSPKLFRGVRWNRGSNTGCVLSHMTILNMCRLQNLPYCIIFEDDAYPRPDVVEMWDKIKYNIPEDCGLLKLGSSSFRGDIKNINSYVDMMVNGSAFGSHAYIIRKEMFPTVINFMTRDNIPEAFLNYENFINYYYKPYVLNFDSMLFIQKNINIDNIISNKGGERYWFPSKTKKCGCTSGLPCENFVDKLIDDESDYIECLSIIECSEFKKKKKTGIVNNNFFYTKDESGELIQISNSKYLIKWNECLPQISKYTYLQFKYELNNVKYYTLTRTVE